MFLFYAVPSARIELAPPPSEGDIVSIQLRGREGALYLLTHHYSQCNPKHQTPRVQVPGKMINKSERQQ